MIGVLVVLGGDALAHTTQLLLLELQQLLSLPRIEGTGVVRLDWLLVWMGGGGFGYIVRCCRSGRRMIAIVRGEVLLEKNSLLSSITCYSTVRVFLLLFGFIDECRELYKWTRQ